jgi:hypothetical protein
VVSPHPCIEQRLIALIQGERENIKLKQRTGLRQPLLRREGDGYLIMSGRKIRRELTVVWALLETTGLPA